jgi:hypothetical protein
MGYGGGGGGGGLSFGRDDGAGLAHPPSLRMILIPGPWLQGHFFLCNV